MIRLTIPTMLRLSDAALDIISNFGAEFVIVIKLRYGKILLYEVK